MGRVSDKIIATRTQLLGRVIKIYLDQGGASSSLEFVGVAELFGTYNRMARGSEKIGRPGNFAKFLSSRGLNTGKEDGRVVLMLDNAALHFAEPQVVGPEPREPLQRPAPVETPAPFPGTAHPVRVDATVVLKNVAEAYEGMFDHAGRSTHEVTELIRTNLNQLAEVSPEKRKAVCLELLAGAMILNGRE